MLDHHRFFLVPRLPDGRTLKLLIDSGGMSSINMISARRLGLSLRSVNSGPYTFSVAELPAMAEWIPEVAGPYGSGLPAGGEGGFELPGDGMLGQFWLRERVWTFDYREGKLYFGDFPAADIAEVELGFATDAEGNRTNNFPRIEASIAGQSLDLLLDTGATVVSPGGAERATSFIISSILEEWHRDHPDWPLVEDCEADRPGTRGIHVPAVTVGPCTIGPVWFTERPDAVFRDHLSSMMDRPIQGALGGSCFRYCRLTLDYPRARARLDLGCC